MSAKKKIIRSYRRGKGYKKEENSSVANRLLKAAAHHNCQYCGPWDFENKVGRKSKRGTKKPKSKNKRK